MIYQPSNTLIVRRAEGSDRTNIGRVVDEGDGNIIAYGLDGESLGYWPSVKEAVNRVIEVYENMLDVRYFVDQEWVVPEPED